jgi:hypothetical protein
MWKNRFTHFKDPHGTVINQNGSLPDCAGKCPGNSFCAGGNTSAAHTNSRKPGGTGDVHIFLLHDRFHTRREGLAGREGTSSLALLAEPKDEKNPTILTGQ